ncbi:TetR family transcriptional regulator [Rhizocola hellebori]|uniref:TetR family transcriptional regulator n=1 Tax=Rhizocola hellebori TaxID=1392758 RepID=A0A8J3QAL6_9ACTN|nr:TetR/AcrR family transcriptional regulator [Rhizocola hellebori]GIH06080.1 TetR family transcriptional regulator [Rhizocola hellebori]
MRADAQRNRSRLLAAAEEVFAAKGIGAPVDEVARAAGVGIGTLFRHFATKEALLEAVYVARLQRLTDQVSSLSGAQDPAAVLTGFFADAVRSSGTKMALAAALAEAGIAVDAANASYGSALRQELGALLTRAQQAGGIRGDIAVGEFISLLAGTSQAVSGHDDATRDRILNVVLDGLRAGDTR